MLERWIEGFQLGLGWGVGALVVGACAGSLFLLLDRFLVIFLPFSDQRDPPEHEDGREEDSLHPTELRKDLDLVAEMATGLYGAVTGMAKSIQEVRAQLKQAAEGRADTVEEWAENVADEFRDIRAQLTAVSEGLQAASDWKPNAPEPTGYVYDENSGNFVEH